jgi:hypothetical protein
MHVALLCFDIDGNGADSAVYMQVQSSSQCNSSSFHITPVLLVLQVCSLCILCIVCLCSCVYELRFNFLFGAGADWSLVDTIAL